MRPALAEMAILTTFGLALLSSSPLEAQGKPPLVGVEFHIEAPDFQRNLGAELSEVEAYLGELLAQLGNNNFGFVRWQRVSPAGDESPLSAVLHVSLHKGPKGPVGPTIWLSFSARPGHDGTTFDCNIGDRFPLEDEDFKCPEKLKLFEGTVYPSGESTAVKESVQEKLEHAFGSDRDFQNKLLRDFLNKIPISHDATLKGNRVALGIEREALKAGEMSRMKLALCVLSPQKRTRTGALLCLDAVPSTQSFEDRRLKAQVGTCKYPDSWMCRTELFPEAELCKQKISYLFEYAMENSVDVFMLDYVQEKHGAKRNSATSSVKESVRPKAQPSHEFRQGLRP